MIKIHLLNVIFFLSNFVCAQSGTRLIKITPNDRTENAQFGWTTGITNQYCIVGSPHVDEEINGKSIPDVGAAYIFKKQPDGKWIQHQQLKGDFSKHYNFFGNVVCINDQFAFVSATGDDNTTDLTDGSRKGAVYVYKKSPNGLFLLSQKIILTIRNNSDSFGKSMFVNDSILAIGAIGKTVNNVKLSGTVFIYKLSIKGIWELSATVPPPTHKGELFGSKICLTKNKLLITSDLPERTYVFEKNNDSSYIFLKELLPSVASDSRIGSAIAMNDDYIFVGTTGTFDKNGGNPTCDPISLAERQKQKRGAGAVYVFSNKTSEYVLLQRLVPLDQTADMYFGHAISLSGNKLIISAVGERLSSAECDKSAFFGSAYVFDLHKDRWSEKQKLISPIRSYWDKFAFSVSICSEYMIIGSRFDDEDFKEKNYKIDAGSAYILKLD